MLSACSHAPAPEIVKTEAPPPVVLNDPDPIQARHVDWLVVNSGDSVYFALTPQSYSELALFFADVQRWVREVKFRLDYYRDREK